MSGGEVSMLEAPDWPFLPSANGLFGAVLMSDCDHEVDEDVAQRLREQDALAEYTGWNFHATCWHTGGLFYAEVCVYHVHQGTLSAETPQELMRKVSEVFE